MITFKPASHVRLSRPKQFVVQRWADGLSHPDDYEESVAVTSDILSILSLKISAQYYGGTGRDCCCVGPMRTQREKENKKKYVGPSCNM
jgi:hypothetical protein